MNMYVMSRNLWHKLHQTHKNIISNSIYAGCRVTVHSWLTAYFKFNCQCLLEYLLALKFCHKIHVLCADICHTNSIIKVKAPMRVSYATLFHWHISFAFFRRRKYIQALKSLATWLNSRLTDRILLDYFPFLLQTTNHLSHSQDLDMFRKTWINAWNVWIVPDKNICSVHFSR